MPLQILKAMPERNICSQGSKQKKLCQGYNYFTFNKKYQKEHPTSLQAGSLGHSGNEAKQEGECPAKLSRRLHLAAKIEYYPQYLP